eukprot:TRINITY_DN15765_c0_g1_i1.p2 TRINITY_DN15765_c0_g1~~TRINITY_DN15765_c0_g1_i1.p2  ORF type:complete len:146 (+),score=41.55 TRINITY_DN15765_c0_g1_i1:35-439(+)
MSDDVDMRDASTEEDEEDESMSEMDEVALQCVLRDDVINFTILCEAGFDHTAWSDESGMTLVHWAACNGSPKVLAFMLKKTPELAALTNVWDETALVLATRKNHPAVIAMFGQLARGEPLTIPQPRPLRTLTIR